MVQVYIQKIRNKDNGRTGMVELQYHYGTGQFHEPHRYSTEDEPKRSAYHD